VSPIYDLVSADETPPGPFDLTFVDQLDQTTTYTFVDMANVIPHEFRSQTMKLRKSLDPKWQTGYRDPDDEEFPQ